MTRSRIRKYALTAVLSLGLTVGLMACANANEDDDVAPAPPSIGADVPLTYFGPAPSDVQKELIGPYQLLKSGKIDHDTSTLTLPLYKGTVKGRRVWFIVTDTTDKGNADQLGINFSPKLFFANLDGAVRKARITKGFEVEFENGKVDFSPNRSLTPGDAPHHFPPKAFQPGSVGSDGYTPLIEIVNAGGHVYNAPVVADGVDEATLNRFCDSPADHSIVHDKVVNICPKEGTVTVALTPGFSFSRPVLYISTEAMRPITRLPQPSKAQPTRLLLRLFRLAVMTACSARLNGFSFSPTARPVLATPSVRGLTAPLVIMHHRSMFWVVSRPLQPITARSGISISGSGPMRRSARVIVPG